MTIDHECPRSYLNPLVHLEPGRVSLRVLELEAKVPHLAQPDGAAHEVEQLLPARLHVQAELELGVHRRHLHGERLDRLLLLEHVAWHLNSFCTGTNRALFQTAVLN